VELGARGAASSGSDMTTRRHKSDRFLIHFRLVCEARSRMGITPYRAMSRPRSGGRQITLEHVAGASGVLVMQGARLANSRCDARLTDLPLRRSAEQPRAGSASVMVHHAHWSSTDQIPRRLIDADSYKGQPFGRFNSLDPTDGDETTHSSVSGRWHRLRGKELPGSRLHRYTDGLPLFAAIFCWRLQELSASSLLTGSSAARIEMQAASVRTAVPAP